MVWDYLGMYMAGFQCCTVKEDSERSGLEEVTMVRPDISDYMDFHFYETIKFDQVSLYPGT